jgi:hypothetical protein
MTPTKPLLLLGAGLLLIGCATSNSGAACATYRRYAPTVSRQDTELTIQQIDDLDLAMEAACGW